MGAGTIAGPATDLAASTLPLMNDGWGLSVAVVAVAWVLCAWSFYILYHIKSNHPDSSMIGGLVGTFTSTCSLQLLIGLALILALTPFWVVFQGSRAYSGGNRI